MGRKRSHAADESGSSTSEDQDLAGKSQLPELYVQRAQCPTCQSTRAKTTKTDPPFECGGTMLVRRWRKCLDCGQSRIERTPEKARKEAIPPAIGDMTSIPNGNDSP